MDVLERCPLPPWWAAGEQQNPNLFTRSLTLASRFAPARAREQVCCRRARAEPIGALAHCGTLRFVV
jgi:hypothetical protein